MANEKISDLNILPSALGTDKFEISTVAGPTTFSSDRDQGVTFTQTQFAGTDPINYIAASGTYSLNINSTNLQVSGSDLNTIQDIDTTAQPEFTSVSLETSATQISLNASLRDVKVLTGIESATVLQFVGINHGSGNPATFYGAVSDGTEATPTIVENGQTSVQLSGLGFDGSTYRPLGVIQIDVDGTPGSGDMPGRLVFATTPDGGVSPIEGMRMTSSQTVGIGGTPDPSALLDVQSTTQGVRDPNMTTAQRDAISSPAAGLRIFNTTTQQFQGFTGASWVLIG